MAYLVEHVTRHADQNLNTENPRQELIDYLNEPLRESGTDIIKWWCVSKVIVSGVCKH